MASLTASLLNRPKSDLTPVITTLPSLPLPSNAVRPTVTTERLVIRPPTQADLPALHALRTQPAVMANTSTGKVDLDEAFTQARLDPFLSPRDETSFNYAICLREEPGRLIGIGGCHRLSSEFGWPTVGYMIREEFWGKGLTTEFLRAWLAMWSDLPRRETELLVDPRTIAAGASSSSPGVGVVTADGEAAADIQAAQAVLPVVPEHITAIVLTENTGSVRVMQKCGFQEFTRYEEPDHRDPNVKVELIAFRYFPHKSARPN